MLENVGSTSMELEREVYDRLYGAPYYPTYSGYSVWLKEWNESHAETIWKWWKEISSLTYEDPRKLKSCQRMLKIIKEREGEAITSPSRFIRRIHTLLEEHENTSKEI